MTKEEKKYFRILEALIFASDKAIHINEIKKKFLNAGMSMIFCPNFKTFTRIRALYLK